jgi:TIR domain
MFNILVSYSESAWETDQLMRMDVGRFGEFRGIESESISVANPSTLKSLEHIDTLLIYEEYAKNANVDVIRYGYLHGIKVVNRELVFRFEEKGRFTRLIVKEFAQRLGISDWEFTRTHWAVKDAGIPRAMLARMMPSFDIVFSFAGADREYVRKVAQYLRKKNVSIFYDENAQVHLWGKDLAEHFELLYRRSGKYCVIFISKEYVIKNWTRLERRAALSRALTEREEYILPARFDQTEVPGISPTVGYVSLVDKSPGKFGRIILEKLRGHLGQDWKTAHI